MYETEYEVQVDPTLVKRIKVRGEIFNLNQFETATLNQVGENVRLHLLKSGSCGLILWDEAARAVWKILSQGPACLDLGDVPTGFKPTGI